MTRCGQPVRLRVLFFVALPAVSSSPHPCCSVEKIVEIDTHIGVAISGLTADATTLIDHARVEAQYHTFTYDEPIKVESLTQSVCDLKMRFGEGSDGDKSKPKMVEFLPAACHPCSFSRVRSTVIVHYFSFPFLCPPPSCTAVASVRRLVSGGGLRRQGRSTVRSLHRTPFLLLPDP